MFFFCKEGKFFSSFIGTSIRDEIDIKAVTSMPTPYGELFLIDEKSSNLFDYLTYGKKALFLNKNEGLNGVLLGADFKLHKIRASLEGQEPTVRVATHDLRNPLKSQDFKLLVCSSDTVLDTLRGFVYGDHPLAVVHKALGTLNFFSGAVEIMPKDWKKGVPLHQYLRTQQNKLPLVNPDFKAPGDKS